MGNHSCISFHRIADPRKSYSSHPISSHHLMSMHMEKDKRTETATKWNAWSNNNISWLNHITVSKPKEFFSGSDSCSSAVGVRFRSQRFSYWLPLVLYDYIRWGIVKCMKFQSQSQIQVKSRSHTGGWKHEHPLGLQTFLQFMNSTITRHDVAWNGIHGSFKKLKETNSYWKVLTLGCYVVGCLWHDGNMLFWAGTSHKKADETENMGATKKKSRDLRLRLNSFYSHPSSDWDLIREMRSVAGREILDKIIPLSLFRIIYVLSLYSGISTLFYLLILNAFFKFMSTTFCYFSSLNHSTQLLSTIPF